MCLPNCLNCYQKISQKGGCNDIKISRTKGIFCSGACHKAFKQKEANHSGTNNYSQDNNYNSYSNQYSENRGNHSNYYPETKCNRCKNSIHGDYYTLGSEN